MLNPILNTGGAKRSPVKAFYGINRKKYANPGECVSCLNVNGDEFPVLRSVKENKSVLTSTEEITKLLPPDEGEEMKLIGVVGGEVVGEESHTVIKHYEKGVNDILKMGDTLVCLPTAQKELKGVQYNKQGYTYYNVRSVEMGKYFFETLNTTVSSSYGDVKIKKKLSYLKVENNKGNSYIWRAGEDDYFMIEKTSRESIVTINVEYRYGALVCYYKRNSEGVFELTDNAELSSLAFDKDEDPPYNEGYETKYALVTEYEDIPLACVHQNRLWGVSGDGSEVRCSKVGSPTNFTDYDDGAASAWFTSVGSEGKFTGITPYNNSIFAFKASCVHVIYGTVPQNYSMEKTFSECGCIDGDSIIVVNNALYWLGYNGIYRYVGGTPKIISENLNKKYKKCVSFSDNEKLYLNLTDYDGKSELLCYDTVKGLWHGFPYFDFLGGFLFDGKLYAYTKNELFEISGGEYGDWCFESVLEYYDGFENCSATEIFLRAELKAGSRVKVEYKGISESDWENCGEYRADEDCMIKEKFVLRFRQDKAYQFKISGYGEAYIYELERTVSGSGRKNS